MTDGTTATAFALSPQSKAHAFAIIPSDATIFGEVEIGRVQYAKDTVNDRLIAFRETRHARFNLKTIIILGVRSVVLYGSTGERSAVLIQPLLPEERETIMTAFERRYAGTPVNVYHVS